jgi:hypothetical protein
MSEAPPPPDEAALLALPPATDAEAAVVRAGRRLLAARLPAFLAVDLSDVVPDGAGYGAPPTA